MIVLGQRYTFTSFELEALKEDFAAIDFIDYKDQDPDIIIEQIDSLLEYDSKRTVILNTKAVILDKLLAYLTKLELRGVEFITISSFLERYLHKCHIYEDKTDISFLAQIKHFTPRQYILKRVIDFVGVAFVTFFSTPVMLYSIYRIRKESPEGPILYVQDRVGLDGKEFKCYKFRSMRPDAEAGLPQFASKDDERTFPWGESMRKLRFDELPQMWNVIKGDMHLMGPRPERKYWVDKFEKEIPYYNERHIIRPGITGWAQVKYPYGENTEDARQKLMYDLYYIKNWSVAFEFLMVWKTSVVVFGKKGV